MDTQDELDKNAKAQILNLINAPILIKPENKFYPLHRAIQKNIWSLKNIITHTQPHDSLELPLLEEEIKNGEIRESSCDV